MPEKTEAQKKAQQKYMENFSVARVRMTKDRLEEVKTHAIVYGESTSAFINRAIDETIERDRELHPITLPEGMEPEEYYKKRLKELEAQQPTPETISKAIHEIRMMAEVRLFTDVQAHKFKLSTPEDRQTVTEALEKCKAGISDCIDGIARYINFEP